MAYKPREVICIDCKKLFMKKSTKSVRCPECQRAYNKARQREYYRERIEAETQNDPHVCTRLETCLYGITAGSIMCCDYMRITGHKRPCAVRGCAEYRRKRTGGSSK